MTYKERVQEEIEEKKLRSLWQEVCESYEQGGVEQVKSALNSWLGKAKEDYHQVLEALKKML